MRSNGAQPELALDQRQLPHVFAPAPKQVEGDKAGLAASEQQVSELRFAVAVEAHDFAVEHSRPSAEFGCQALV